MTPDELSALTRRPAPGEHRATVEIDGIATATLADLPPLRDHLLFVGLNPSPVSVEAGHYHQGRLGRTFWRRLMLATVLPPATPVETADDALLEAGHGITDLLKGPTARDEATDAALRAGVGPLWQKVAIWRPAAIVFVYKRAATACAGRPAGGVVGTPAGRGPCRAAVLPDAGPVRADRGGRRGAQLPAQPDGGPAARPRLDGFGLVRVDIDGVGLGRESKPEGRQQGEPQPGEHSSQQLVQLEHERDPRLGRADDP